MPLVQLHSIELSLAVEIDTGWSGSSFRRSIMCLAGTAILPSSSVVSTSISVRRVSSESDAVTCRILPWRSNRKLSRMGNADFAGTAFEIAISPLRSSVLETLNFISS